MDHLKCCSSTGVVDSAKVSAVTVGDNTPDGEKHGADVTPPVGGAVEPATSGDEEVKNLTRLLQEYVNTILSWVPDPIQDPEEYYNRMINDPLQLFSQGYIDRSTESLRVLAEISEENNYRFKEFQDWARADYEAKGYVEVDDDYIAHGVLLSLAAEDEDFDPEIFLGSSAVKEGEGVSVDYH